MDLNRMLIVVGGSLVAVLALVGLMGSQFNPDMMSNSNAKPTEAVMKKMTVSLTQQNNSGQNGTATLTEVNGKVVVSVNIPGGTVGVEQPAHLHLGSCTELGDVKYPLNSVLNGASETTLTVSMDELKQSLPLALNVHKSAAQVKTYVACGNLSAQ